MPVRRRLPHRPIPFAAHGGGEPHWLHAVLAQAVRCSLVSSLALAACTYNTGNGDPWRHEHVTCEGDARWRLARALSLAEPVDYVADRAGKEVLSEWGVQCAGASEPDTCTRELDFGGPNQHLVTTQGDKVQLWSDASALQLLGELDTSADAIWWLRAQGYHIACDADISLGPQGFQIGAERSEPSNCSMDRAHVTANVAPDGTITESNVTLIKSAPRPCAGTGRRPEGLLGLPPCAAACALGRHFAAMAQLEAAAVPAFEAIASELASYGAPRALVFAAERARRDEIRHARIAGQLAWRYGARAGAPSVRRMPPRSLEAFALDNAIEGCVHETYAAAEAAHQAVRARDPWVARALSTIAADETRHAALSWSIARWCEPLLGASARARVRAARRDSAAQLGSRLAPGAEPLLCAQAGVPDARAATALHTQLSRELWS